MAGGSPWCGVLYFARMRCRLYPVKMGFASAIRPMAATVAAEYKCVAGSNKRAVDGVFQSGKMKGRCADQELNHLHQFWRRSGL
jgi:hypothetical protein